VRIATKLYMEVLRGSKRARQRRNAPNKKLQLKPKEITKIIRERAVIFLLP
jgi:hypothetical protein